METCPYCARSFSTITSRHKAVCVGWPKAPPPDPCLCGHVSTSNTQQKRHKQGCEIWKARDVEKQKAEIREKMRVTSLVRYGVEDASQAPEVIARRKATNIARYGAENPFSKEASTFEKVQDSLDGKRPILRGADNPFAKPEVKKKIRSSMIEKYGAASPQQVPEIRARSRATNLERYGGELLGSPILREKANETNLVRYGFTEPSRNPEVVERIRQTNLAKYGVEWTNQDPEIRRKQLETMHEKYGSHFFASEEGKREVRAALLERYGVEFPGAIDGHWEKAVAAFRKRYGVVHPLQLDLFLEKRVETNRRIYGVDSPLQNPDIMAKSLKKMRETFMKNWGVPHPMMNRDHARERLMKMGTNMGPTLPERLVASFAPSLVYTAPEEGAGVLR